MAQFSQLCYIVFIMILLKQNASAKKHATTGGEKCYRYASDVVLAIDSSFSIRKEDFHHQLVFLKRLIDTFTIGKNHIQVGVVSFGSKVRRDIRLDQFVAKTKLKLAVGKIEHMDSGTFTHEAIRYIRTQMFLPENGGRPWAKKKLVVITDGQSSKTNSTVKEAELARDARIEIFGVGIGERFEDFEAELRHVVSEPKSDHLFKVRDYGSLDTINKMLSDAACERAAGEGSVNNKGSKEDVLKECKKNAAELVFVLDSSNSIWEPDFKKQIKFVKDVTATFEIGNEATRVAMVLFSDDASVLHNLDSTQTTDFVHYVLDSVTMAKGNTNTAKALHHVRTRVLSKARPKVPRIVVLLTDGKSDNAKHAAREAQKLHRDGIHVFTIGIGEWTDARDLMAMASNPDDEYVFHVDNFDGLANIRDLLVLKSCDVATDTMQKDKEGATDDGKCPKRPNDVVFVYDAEWLSRRENNFIVNTISGVIESEVLNTKELRFGVIRDASHEVSLRDIKLTDNWNQPSFKTKLDADSKRSLIDRLLYKARKQYFPKFRSDHRKRTVVLFMDSEMTDLFQTYQQAYWLGKSKVEIIIVGLGKHFNKMTAYTLTSRMRNLIMAYLDKNKPRVLDVVTKIIDRLCDDRVK